jgi:fused signal recognition particle receptor
MDLFRHNSGLHSEWYLQTASIRPLYRPQDAAQGRMALDSARVWSKEIGLSGLILTKLDGTARGGSVVAVSRDLRLPVKLIGVGEGIDDLRDVSRTAF